MHNLKKHPHRPATASPAAIAHPPPVPAKKPALTIHANTALQISSPTRGWPSSPPHVFNRPSTPRLHPPQGNWRSVHDTRAAATLRTLRPILPRAEIAFRRRPSWRLLRRTANAHGTNPQAGLRSGNYPPASWPLSSLPSSCGALRGSDMPINGLGLHGRSKPPKISST